MGSSPVGGTCKKSMPLSQCSSLTDMHCYFISLHTYLRVAKDPLKKTLVTQNCIPISRVSPSQIFSWNHLGVMISFASWRRSQACTKHILTILQSLRFTIHHLCISHINKTNPSSGLLLKRVKWPSAHKFPSLCSSLEECETGIQKITGSTHVARTSKLFPSTRSLHCQLLNI